MSIGFRFILLIVGVLGLATAVARAASPEAIEQSLAKAKQWLLAQEKNGNWEDVAAPDPIDKRDLVRHPKYGQVTGRTALAVLALLNSGESNQNPNIKSAIDFILKTPTQGVYALGLRCQLWLALPQTPQTLEAMRNDAKILLTSAKKGGNATGMYDYVPGPSKEYSHSRAQYAVLGLWAAAQMGVEIPNAYWQMAEEAWKRNQSKDGGWTYRHPKESGPFVNTPGMTTVGIATLFITQEQIHSGEGLTCHGNQSNPAIEKGIEWLANHMDLYATGNTYMHGYPYATLYAFERVGAASGLRYIGDVDWYEKGSDFAIRQQAANGSWTWAASDLFEPQVSTCFAMLFLAKGRAPIVMSKLQYVDAATNKEARWNQRSRDVANVTRWIGHLIERDLAFQIIDLDAAIEDVIESPILFIAGSEPLNLSDKHKEKLKTFIESGGIILANADCGNAAFVTSLKKMAGAMFPEYEFTNLKDNDILYTDYYPRSKWRNKPRIEALSNGSRKLIVLIPEADPAKAWQIHDSRSKSELFELAANLLLYSVDRQELRNRGKRYYIPDNPKLKPSQSITITRLKYAGNWNPEPGGWRRLNNVMLRQQATGVDVKVAELGKNQLSGAKIAHLTGTDTFKFSQPQRDEITQFVEAGGTLIVDAAGGASDFATSVEAEFGRLFPNSKPAVLPADHALYSAGGTAISEVSYRNFSRRAMGRSTTPRLQGIMINDRLAVIYSREDLSTGLVGQAVDGVIGYTPETATNLMLRCLNYAAGIKTAHKPLVAVPNKPASEPATVPEKPATP